MTIDQGDTEAERTARFWPGAIAAGEEMLAGAGYFGRRAQLLLWGWPRATLLRLGLADERIAIGVPLFDPVKHSFQIPTMPESRGGYILFLHHIDLPFVSQKQAYRPRLFSRPDSCHKTVLTVRLHLHKQDIGAVQVY